MRNIPEQANLTRLLMSGKKQRLPKGQSLQFTGDRMIVGIIESGFVKRYSITNDGSQSIQSIYGPGDVFPLTPVFKTLFDQSLYTGQEEFYYEALSPITVYTIHRSVLESAVAEDPLLYKDILYVAGVRLRSNIQRLENISLRSAAKQVAHQLLFMAEQFGQVQGNTIILDLPLTHQTLANILNLARETVSHSMSRMQQKGLITQDPKLTVLDVEGLRQAAN